ncbi:MAG: hypothetical protein KAI71_02585 [Candidatus Pacebacteria bacterium]|nr:hypothetical protein [Candidatus Paceibacterota bacterium]
MKKLLIVVGILFAFSANATTIPEGAVIKTANNPDVYIVKYKNGKQFKRLVLNQQVFESYGHLRWEDILIVDQAAIDSFMTSNLVRADGQAKVYQLVANGDIGSKHYLDFNSYDLDSVYTINSVDFGNYVIGEVRGITKTSQENINTESTDEKLQKMISINKECIKTNTERIKENEALVIKINNEINKYSEYSLVQQSGQQLISEIKNDSHISNKISNICNELVDESIALLGLEKSSFSRISYLTDQFTSYTKQRDMNYDKIGSIMNSYVLNVKSALKQEIAEKSEKLERMTASYEAIEQLNSLISEADNQLNILSVQIEKKNAEIENAKNGQCLATTAQLDRILAKLIPEYNSLIEQYNVYLEIRSDLVSVAGKVNDYGKYGIPLSYKDKLFLQDLGINF